MTDIAGEELQQRRKERKRVQEELVEIQDLPPCWYWCATCKHWLPPCEQSWATCKHWCLALKHCN